jgi:enoyl-CoA hydratase
VEFWSNSIVITPSPDSRVPQPVEANEDPILVDYIEDSRVAIVTLNRPHVANALNTEATRMLGAAIDRLDAEAAVRVVVLTAVGQRAFSAGGDLKERESMTAQDFALQHRLIEDTMARIRNFRKPIFAAVNGVAAGGGCELAMQVDFIIASENARFGQPEVSRGIIPGAGGTQFLPRLIARGKALELLMTGDLISAHEAHRLGLVNEVCRAADLPGRAQEIARRIASNSPAAVQQAKKAARGGCDGPIEQGLVLELACYQLMIGHPDRYEGITAFNERRVANFADAP